MKEREKNGLLGLIIQFSVGPTELQVFLDIQRNLFQCKVDDCSCRVSNKVSDETETTTGEYSLFEKGGKKKKVWVLIALLLGSKEVERILD